MRRARKKESKLKKRIGIFFASFFSVIAIAVAALGFYGINFPANDGEIIDENYVEPVDKATGKANVLILGVDKGGLRTDTIVVASYDLDNNYINMLSIPRDTRMYIGRQYQKINAAHSISSKGKIKGPQGTIEAVTRLTGIPINYYVEFSNSAFRNTIDALGGVEFDVPQRMKYTDPAQDLYIDLQPGLQTLDGDKAEQLVRFRSYPLGDIKRVEVQQQFIKAVAEQKLNTTILTRLPDLFKTLQDDVDTNLTIMDAMKYLPNLKELSTDNITMYQLPGNFSGSEYAASYWLADMDGIKTLVTDVFGYPTDNITNGPAGSTGSADKQDKKRVDSGAQASAKPSATKKPTATQKPSMTQKPTATKKPSETQKPEATAKPTATPQPTATKAPNSEPTAKPAVTPKPEQTQKPEQNKKNYGESNLDAYKKNNTTDSNE